MRDTSAWAGSPYTSKPYVSLSVRQRYPDFQWHSGETYYALPGLGEDWGDSPGTVREARERNLPTRFRYGGFVVAGDSVTLANGNILRVTSLAAGNQGTDLWWQEISSASQLTTCNTISLTSPPKPWSGIALAQHSTPNSARLFFVRGSDGRLMYRDYTAGSGFAGTYQYGNSPVFSGDGIAIAPTWHNEGFVISYSPTSHAVTLHRFQGSTWSSFTMPMRYQQHPLNCHWFDAVPIAGQQSLVTFNVNGVQYATIYDAATATMRNPWTVMAFDPEFGGAQTRICKLTKVGNRVMATAWSRFAGSSDDYDVSYYHLLWTDNGYYWATPEEGYIGQMACRGKLHTIGNTAYVVGSSVSYIGDAVTWLGGSVGVHTSTANNVVGHNLIQDLDRASDAKLPLLITDNFDKSLLTYGNELVLGIGIEGESPVTISTMTMDTPDETLDGRSQAMNMVCRGPLKRLISFQAPMDQTIMGVEAYHADFTIGNLYARAGTWSHEVAGIAYCELHDGSEAIATVGTQYSGQFQIATRLRITKATDGAAGGVVFWYEGPQDYCRVDLSDSGVSLRQYDAGVETILNTTAITGGFVADTWYDLFIRYVNGRLLAHVRPNGGSWQQVIVFDGWSHPEPARWYTGLFCTLPSAKTTQALSLEATHKVDVDRTTGFPAAGEIKVNSEIIAYGSKTGTKFGTGEANSLIRGVRTVRMSHPEDSPVTVADRRFEADRFSIFQDGRAMSVADACEMLITSSGTPFVPTPLVDNSSPGVRVFPELHGHSWILEGEYSGPFTLYFWTNTTNPPVSGVKLECTTTTAILSDLSASEIMRYPFSMPTDGTFRCHVETNTIYLWINGRMAVAFHVPGKQSFRTGSVGCNNGVIRMMADELYEPAEGVVWNMRESARDVLQRLMEGRDVHLRERSDGAVQVTLLEKRDDLGELNGQYFVFYQRAAADQEWASAMIAWGAEEWVMVMEPDADRLRWISWQTPHIYDRTTLRHRAMRRLRKLWALKDLRVLRGPYDPRVEVGDQLSIAHIRGIPAGRHLVRSIEVVGEPALLDMKVTVQALPDDVTVATWPIKPGIDRPAEG
jgi:hypothetical protein